MRALVQHRYGGPDVVEVEERPTPVPGTGELRIRVHASTVGPADAAFRSGRPWFARLYSGLRRPKWPIGGSDYVGVVDAIGADVGGFAVGQRVWGTTTGAFGAHAEYVVVPATVSISVAPESLGDVEAATLVDATAMSFLRDTAELRAGQSILIRGASGGVGSLAVQLAKHLGARVTGVCSTANLDYVRGLGADEVVDYTREDYTAQGIRYDVIFDVVGGERIGRVRRALSDRGLYMTTVPTFGVLARMLVGPLTRRRATVSFTGLRSDDRKRVDLVDTGVLAEAGVLKPVVGAAFPMEQAAAAHRLVDGGKRGVVVLMMTGAATPSTTEFMAASHDLPRARR